MLLLISNFFMLLNGYVESMIAIFLKYFCLIHFNLTLRFFASKVVMRVRGSLWAGYVLSDKFGEAPCKKL